MKRSRMGETAIFLFFALLLPCGPIFAQRSDAGSLDNRGESETPLSVNRKNRPPRPSGELENNHFPAGFLTLSTPTDESDTAPHEESPDTKKKAEEGEPRSANSDFLLASIVGIGFLTLFFWSHYRHRAWLETVLTRNRQLLSGEDLSDDFHDYSVHPLFAGVGAGGGTGSFSTDAIPLSDHLDRTTPSVDIGYRLDSES